MTSITIPTMRAAIDWARRNPVEEPSLSCAKPALSHASAFDVAAH